MRRRRSRVRVSLRKSQGSAKTFAAGAELGGEFVDGEVADLPGGSERGALVEAADHAAASEAGDVGGGEPRLDGFEGLEVEWRGGGGGGGGWGCDARRGGGRGGRALACVGDGEQGGAVLG